MAERLDLGIAVSCTDAKLGELADVVIDPTSKRVVDLVVRAHGAGGPARLVPIEMAEGSSWRDRITLRCTTEEARQFPAIGEAAAMRMGEMPAGDADWDVGVQDVVTMPTGSSMDMSPGVEAWDPLMEVTYDRIPKGKVELRHSSSVVSSDGHVVGKIDAFVVEGDEITHLILERGHLWGRRDVTIPISQVESAETDDVRLAISRDEVGELPSVRLPRRWFK